MIEKSASAQDVAELGIESTTPTTILTTQNNGTNDSTDKVAEDHTTREEDEKSHHSSLSPNTDGHVTDEDDVEANPGEPPIRPVSTRASSIFGANVIPRKERRGLFGSFTIVPEIERPYDYTPKTKWTITAIVALAAAAAPMGSGIFYRMSLVPVLTHRH